jgi:hypothetical protein
MINAEEFEQWCHDNKKQNDSDARAMFVSQKLFAQAPQ